MSSNSARRKRPSANVDSGAALVEGKAAATAAAEGNGVVMATTTTTPTSKGGSENPYDFDEEGALSTQQQQMLRVLEKHRFALSSTQQEVYERLRRKAAKARLSGYDSPGKRGERRFSRCVKT